MKALLERVKPWLLVLLAAVALWLLFLELRQYSWIEVRQSLTEISLWRLLASALLAAFSYLILIGSDLLALRSIGRRLPLRQVIYASLLGSVSSFNFGTLVGGTSVRYHLYSRRGLTALEVIQVTLLLGLTFWIGFLALAGIVFTVVDQPLPESALLPAASSRPVGVVLLLLTAGYLGLSISRWQPWKFWGSSLRLPDPLTTLGQLGISSLDFLGATACLYILVNDGQGMTYFDFLRVVLLANLAMVITHVPGGVGVFELMVVKLAVGYPIPHLLAGLLVFRLVYYLLPLTIALVVIGCYELARRWPRITAWFQKTTNLGSSSVPQMLAAGTFLAGAILLISGVTSAQDVKEMAQQQLHPSRLVRSSFLLPSAVGVSLLLTSFGVHRRLDVAWWLATALIVAGILLSVLLGFGYGEAAVLAAIVMGLLVFRRLYSQPNTP